MTPFLWLSSSDRLGSRTRSFSFYDLVGYRRRWQLLSILQPRYVSAAAPIVIGGCGRSGTTLLSTMLNRHPDVTCGPESTVFLGRVTDPFEIARRYGLPPHKVEQMQRQSRSQAEFIDLFRTACLAATGRRVWAEKTPENVRRLCFLFRHFPRAQFVHIVRDGRDVACSLRQQPWMKLPGDRFSLAALEACAMYWLARVGLGQACQPDWRFIEVRYEDLVRDPEHELRRLLRALGLRWHPSVLDTPQAADVPEHGPIYSTAVGRWRHELSIGETNAVVRHAGTMLAALGYEPAR